MKNTKFLSTIVIFIFAISVFGQNSIIQKEEYDAALNDSRDKTEKHIRRETSVNLRYSNGAITETYTNIWEYLPPNRSRWTNIFEKPNSLAERKETINIGDKTYNKKNRGQWELESKNLNSRIITGASIGNRLNTEDCWQYMKFAAEMNDQPATQYFSYNVSNIKGVLYFFEDRKWISGEGLMLKSTVKVSTMVPENVTSTITTIYAYDPKDLKIEAPIK